MASIINSLTKELERLKDENKTIIKEKEAILQKMEERGEEVADSTQQAHDVILEMRRERDEQDALWNAKIDTLKNQHAREYQQLHQAREEACTKMETDYNELYRKWLEIIKQLNRCKDDKDKLTEQLASKHKQIESLLSDNTGWANKYKNLEDKHKDLRARLDIAQAKLRKESVIITKAELANIVSGAVKRTYHEAPKPHNKRDRSHISSHNSSHTSSSNSSDKATTTVKKARQ